MVLLAGPGVALSGPAQADDIVEAPHPVCQAYGLWGQLALELVSDISEAGEDGIATMVSAADLMERHESRYDADALTDFGADTDALLRDAGSRRALELASRDEVTGPLDAIRSRLARECADIGPLTFLDQLRNGG